MADPSPPASPIVRARVASPIACSLDAVAADAHDLLATRLRLEALAAENRAQWVGSTIRLEALARDMRRAERPRFGRAAPLATLRDGAHGSVAPGRDDTAESLRAYGLAPMPGPREEPATALGRMAARRPVGILRDVTSGQR